MQVITGCTLGKGNIQKTHKGKWGLTLIDKKKNKAVRVSPKGNVMIQTKGTPFFKEYRAKGVAPTQVPDEVVESLVVKVMTEPDDQLLDISEVYEYNWKNPLHSFASFLCEERGEMVVESYGRIKSGKHVCIDCAG